MARHYHLKGGPMAQGVADRRKGDPGRPSLTTERVRELLRAVPIIHERDPEIGRFIFQPDSPDDSGKSAAKLLGKKLATVVDEVTGDAHAFARDLFWLHTIAFRLRDGGTIDEHLARADAFSISDDWKPIRKKQREGLAGAVSGVASLLERVSRAEEQAVRVVVDDALAMFFRYRKIR
jgi:hypothetical protein